MANKPIIIGSQPGVKRDNTTFDGDNYIDAQWCRFYRGRPKKIAGYRAVTSTIPELARGMHAFVSNGSVFVHVGGATKLSQVVMDSNGLLTGFNARVPGTLVNSSSNLWQFDVMYDSVSNSNRLIAHAAPNLMDISSNTAASCWLGDVTAAAALTAIASSSVSGGIVVLAPYLFAFGSDGYVTWSVANKPSDLTNAGSGSARITGSKIVRGIPLRGSGAGPAGLFWSLDSLLRANFVGGTAIWAFDTISTETSILSSQSVIEYDGIFYWLGVDRPLMFNGVVREIPNNMNLDWFYDNLNYTQRQKVFAFKVPRYGEIWWCYPRGNATECTHAIIYNIRENIWYDTQLPSTGRTAGVFAKVYNKPFMIDLDPVSSQYTLWQHETGLDQINGSSVQPIQSYFETNEITLLTAQDSLDKSLRVSRIEPDFVQSGDLTLKIGGRQNARDTNLYSETFTISDAASDAAEQVVRTKEIRRLMRFRFESNVAGGDYYLGKSLAAVEPADGRYTR